MNAHTPVVKHRDHALLKNMITFLEAVNELIDCPTGEAKFGVLHGVPGLGKTYSTIYARNETGAVLVQIDESYNRKEFLRSILTELGVAKPRGSIAELTREAALLLGEDRRRPLIIDEADKLVDKGMIELARALLDKAKVPVLLVGEEELPNKLKATDRVFDRLGPIRQAVRCDLADCRKLATVFLRHSSIDDELLARVQGDCDGRPRRIVQTFADMSAWSRNHGVVELTASNYGGTIFTGKLPTRAQSPLALGGRQ